MPTNNGVLMRNVVQLFLAANTILLETTLFSFFDRSCVKMADRFASRRYSLKNKLGDWMIEQLLNSVIAKYRDLSVSRRSIICLSWITDLLATDKSWYFAITECNNCYFGMLWYFLQWSMDKGPDKSSPNVEHYTFLGNCPPTPPLSQH